MPTDDNLDGLRRINRYAEKSARRERRKLPGHISSEDIAQDVHLLMCQTLENATYESALRELLPEHMPVLSRSVRKSLDATRGRQPVSLAEDFDVPQAVTETADLEDSLRVAIGSMSPAQRQIVLFKREGKSDEEIMKWLNCSRATYFRWKKKAFDRLRSALEKHDD